MLHVTIFDYHNFFLKELVTLHICTSEIYQYIGIRYRCMKQIKVSVLCSKTHSSKHDMR